MEYKALKNGLKMPMVGLGVYNISERETQKRLTLDGCIVNVGLFGHSGDDDVWKPGVKEMLDDMHLRKMTWLMKSLSSTWDVISARVQNVRLPTLNKRARKSIIWSHDTA